MLEGMSVIACIIAPKFRFEPELALERLHDRPVLGHCASSVLKSRFVDRSLLITDSIELLSIASEFGLQPESHAVWDQKSPWALSPELLAQKVILPEERQDLGAMLVVLPIWYPLRDAQQLEWALRSCFTECARACVSVRSQPAVHFHRHVATKGQPCPIWSARTGQGLELFAPRFFDAAELHGSFAVFRVEADARCFEAQEWIGVEANREAMVSVANMVELDACRNSIAGRVCA